MLSYQHAYHAGNFADVLKHTVLIQLLKYLKQKTKPICVIDTHAGAGHYPLDSSQAQKNKEFLNGIAKLWMRDDLPPVVRDYKNLVNAFNLAGQLSHYPGSPQIVRHFLAAGDRLFCYERHAAEFKQLNELLKGVKLGKAFYADGFQDSLGLLPPTENRGLILIDPSYEIKSEYQTVVDALIAMHKRFAGGCYALWYPVVDRKRNRYLERTLQASGIKNIQLFELCISPDSEALGMTASGMIVVNPPWTLKDDMKEALPWLAQILGENGQGRYRLEQLAEE